MSFQDVGRPGGGSPKWRTAATSTTSSSGGGPFDDRGHARRSNGRGGGTLGGVSGGFGQVSDYIVQYQKNIGLLEKMIWSIGTPSDNSVLQTQYKLQLDIIHQLGQRIETQLHTQEKKMAAMPRIEAAPLRTTHVKLVRDYGLVEQQLKIVLLDANRRLAAVEAMQRDAAMMEQEEKIRTLRGQTRGGGGMMGGDEGMAWHMKIQEDKINEEIMREREEEIKNIHKGMHQVNEIYKDLAHLVDGQQEGIHQIETQMETAELNTATGLKHIEEANESSKSACVIS